MLRRASEVCRRGRFCLLYVPEVPEVMRRELLYMLDVVEGELCLLEVLEVMRCVLLFMLEVSEVPEVMRYVCYSVCWRVWTVGSVC